MTAWTPRLMTFVLAAAAAGSAVHWGLRWPQPQSGAGPASMRSEGAPDVIDAQVLGRVLGATDPAVAGGGGLAAVPRLRLLGVVADRQGVGAALIAVDGRPVRAYAVGSRVTDDWVVQSVGPRQAVLAATPSGPAGLTLEMPGVAVPAVFPVPKR